MRRLKTDVGESIEVKQSRSDLLVKELGLGLSEKRKKIAAFLCRLVSTEVKHVIFENAANFNVISRSSGSSTGRIM